MMIARVAVLLACVTTLLCGVVWALVPINDPNAVGLQRSFGSTSSNGQSLITLPNNGLQVALWSECTNPTQRILFRIFDPASPIVGTPVQVTTSSRACAANSRGTLTGSLAALSGGSGGFVVSWSTHTDDRVDGSNEAVVAQMFDDAGASTSAAFQVNTAYTSRSQVWPDVVGLRGPNAGSFLVAYFHEHTNNNQYSCVAQQFDATGAKVGSEATIAFGVNTNCLAAARADGGVAISVLGTNTMSVRVFTAAQMPPRSVAMEPVKLCSTPDSKDGCGGSSQCTNSYTCMFPLGDGGDYTMRCGTCNSAYECTSVVGSTEQLCPAGIHAPPFFVTAPDADFLVEQSALAVDNSGNVFAALRASGANADDAVHARIFNENGTALTPLFVVNQTTNGAQQWPSVTALDDGTFAVLFRDGTSTDGRIVSQRIAVDGQKVGDAEVLWTGDVYDGPFVAPTTSASNGFEALWFAQENGGFPALVTSVNVSLPAPTTAPLPVPSDGDSSDADTVQDLAGRTFAPLNVVEGEIGLLGVSLDAYGSAQARLNDGRVVVVWTTEINSTPKKWHVTARIVDPTSPLQAQDPAFVVHSYGGSSNYATDPPAGAVAALQGGGFVITWRSIKVLSTKPGVYAQRFDATGQTQGSQIEVFAPASMNNAPTGVEVPWNSVDTMPNGDFVVTLWNGYFCSVSIYNSTGGLVHPLTRVLRDTNMCRSTPLSGGGLLVTGVSHEGLTARIFRGADFPPKDLVSYNRPVGVICTGPTADCYSYNYCSDPRQTCLMPIGRNSDWRLRCGSCTGRNTCEDLFSTTERVCPAGLTHAVPFVISPLYDASKIDEQNGDATRWYATDMAQPIQLANGDLLFVWDSRSSESDTSKDSFTQARLMSADGLPLTSRFDVEPVQRFENRQDLAQTALLDDGNVVVVWRDVSLSISNRVGSTARIVARLLSPLGARIGPVRVLFEGALTHRPSVVASTTDGSGGFEVAWVASTLSAVMTAFNATALLEKGFAPELPQYTPEETVGIISKLLRNSTGNATTILEEIAQEFGFATKDTAPISSEAALKRWCQTRAPDYCQY